jgi:hypothetical protein
VPSHASRHTHLLGRLPYRRMGALRGVSSRAPPTSQHTDRTPQDFGWKSVPFCSRQPLKRMLTRPPQMVPARTSRDDRSSLRVFLLFEELHVAARSGRASADHADRSVVSAMTCPALARGCSQWPVGSQHFTSVHITSRRSTSLHVTSRILIAHLVTPLSSIPDSALTHYSPAPSCHAEQ